MLSILTLIFECIILNFFASPGSTEGPSTAIVILFIAFFSAAFYLDVTRSGKLGNLRTPLLIGYFYRLFFMFFDLYGRGIMRLPNSGGDSEYFYQQGMAFSQGLNNASSAFAKLVGVMFRYLGVSRMYVQFILMLFSVVAIYMAARILVLLETDETKSQKAMYILCLLPNLAILSSIFLRESVVAMFASISLLFFVKWYKGYPSYNFLLAIAAVFAGAMFHSGIVGMILGYILVVILVDRQQQTVKMNISGIGLAIVLALGFVYLFNNYSDVFFRKMMHVSSVENVANVQARGGSTYAAYVGNSNSIANMVIYTPIRIIMFQFSPFFWQIRGAADIIALVFDSFFFMYVYYRTIRYCRMKEAKDWAIVIALFIIGLATTFVFAWGVTNTGTALRHRNKMTVLFGILLALIFEPTEIKDDELHDSI